LSVNVRGAHGWGGDFGGGGAALDQPAFGGGKKLTNLTGILREMTLS
jgi:hypothetical protein